jgi:hypothetical protein
MSLLNYLDNIPGKIFPKLRVRKVDGVFIFPHKLFREVFHVIGALILILISYLLYIYMNTNIPIIIFIVFGIWITYQEFYLHPKKYNQELSISILDWSSWMIPFIVYLIFLY